MASIKKLLDKISDSLGLMNFALLLKHLSMFVVPLNNVWISFQYEAVVLLAVLNIAKAFV